MHKLVVGAFLPLVAVLFVEKEDPQPPATLCKTRQSLLGEYRLVQRELEHWD